MKLVPTFAVPPSTMNPDSCRQALTGGHGANVRLPWYIIPILLGMLAGLVAALLLMSAAWRHNPQGEFHDESGINWIPWLSVGLNWFLVVGGVATAITIGLTAALSRIDPSKS